MTAPASASSSARWIQPTGHGITYAVRDQQEAPAVAKTSSTPPEVPKPEPTRKLIREPGRPVIRIHGEPFFVEHDEDLYYIRHERWSLLGAGDTLSAAYKDLLYGAEEVAPVYVNTPPAELDEEGFRLARFLLRFA